MLDIIESLKLLTSEELKVHLYLTHRAEAQKDLKVGLTLTELARQTDLGVEATRFAIHGLTEKQFLGNEETKKKNVVVLKLLKVEQDKTTVPFTFDNTDETKLATLETELLRLRERYVNDLVGEKSTLREFTRGDERELVIEIETDLGRGLTTNEAMLFGKIVQGFGPERAKDTWRKQAHMAKNPLPALYAMLANGIRGKAAARKEPTKVPDRVLEVLS